MRPIPIYIASFNTRRYTELCVRSIHRFVDQPFELFVGNSGSIDGSAEMLDRLEMDGWLHVEHSPVSRSHTSWLDYWLEDAVASYIVFCDSDMQFLRKSILADMQRAREKTGAAIVSADLLSERSYIDHEIVTRLMPRPSPWLMMIDVAALRPLHTSYAKVTEITSEYPEGQRTFDVGGVIYHRALAAGMRHVNMGPLFRRKFRHYTGASWRTVGRVGRLRKRSPTLVLGQGLEKIRHDQPEPSGFQGLRG